jgi:hypothetical protein
MAIKYFNIRSGETRVAETEPQVSALWGSSDRGPNAHKGQDFGWRLAPEVVVELRNIMRDERALERIAIRYKLPMDAIGEKEILQYISDKTAPKDAPVAEQGDYQDQYEQEIRNLQKPQASKQEGETSVRPARTNKNKK